MSSKWYALRSKARKEEIVHRQVMDKGLEVFYPRLRVNPVNPRARKFVPYFPGYLFIQADLDELGYSFFQWMPHTLGLVSFGGEPAIVPENLIYEIDRRVKSIAEAGGEVFDGLKHGDEVSIDRGPFKGYEAIFDERIPGSERVRVLLKLLDSRRVPTEMPASDLHQKRNQS